MFIWRNIEFLAAILDQYFHEAHIIIIDLRLLSFISLIYFFLDDKLLKSKAFGWKK